MIQMSNYRYAVEGDGTITRGEIVHIGDSDTWRNYWDGDGMVGFTVTYRGAAGLDIVMLAEDSDNERAVAAWQHERSGTRGSDGALDRLAVRIGQGGTEDMAASCFMQISLDRDMDFIVLSWSGDNPEWRSEIESVWHGEVYRIETDKYVRRGGNLVWLSTNLSTGEPVWLSMDSDCTDYYGQDNAVEELVKQFPLDEYPAEVLVDGTD